MSLKSTAVKTANLALWPVKTPKRLVGWLFVGVAVFVFALYGAIIMTRGPKLIAEVKSSIAEAYVRIAGEELAPEQTVPIAVQEPIATPEPAPKPQWTSPTRQSAMLDPRDGCALLAGLNHQIGKCWSFELHDDPRGVSKWLYHADWAMICATKRKVGLSCRR